MPLVSTSLPNLIGGVSQQPQTVRLQSQCEVMENCLPSVADFLRRRPATRHIAKIIPHTVSDAAIHIIDRDVTEQYVVVAAANDLKIFDLHGQQRALTFNASKEYLHTSSPGSEMGFMSINDYTFCLNKTVEAVGLGGLTPERQPEALVFIKQASYATDYFITLDGQEITHTTFKDDNRDTTGLEYTKANGFDMEDTAALDAGRYKLSSTVIAADLAQKISAIGQYTCQAVKSTLWIRRADGGEFTARVSDSRANSHTAITTTRVQKFSDLPTVAPDGFVTEIVGDQSSSFDNYFVKFETNNGSEYDDGVWVETVKPGITYALDTNTLPHALVRQADGTFSFETMNWEDRKCGDLDSAPDPSFVGRKISSVFFYRNRLGFLSRDNCILSEAGRFFNFFPTTVTTMVDSDPIDVAASHTKAANLYHVAPFSEGLILFSDQTQFLLEHEDVLSGATVAVKPITEFACSTKASPEAAGRNIFFATSRGEFGGVREYFVEENTSLSNASDITSHVPHYIRGDIRKLVVSTNEDCLLVLSEQERNTMALYKYMWNGAEKLLSSWSKWTFSGEVLSAAFLNSTLILVMQYEDGVYLEQLNIESGYTDPGCDYEYALDRKITNSDMEFITYNQSTKETTIYFPYTLPAKPAIVTGPGSNSPPSGFDCRIISWTPGGTATVRGDLRNVSFTAGIPFISRYEFSKQIMRENSGTQSGAKLAVTEGRLQLRNFTLTYANTGYFEVHVTPELRKTDIRKFTGKPLSHGHNILGVTDITSGTFRFPVLSRADTASIEIVSNSFLPFQITSAGWEGFYHIRSGRV